MSTGGAADRLAAVDPRPWLGVLAILASTVLVPAMAACVRELSRLGMGTPEILAWRGALVLLVLLPPLALASFRAVVRRVVLRFHVVHAVFGLTGMVGVYVGLAYLPLATVIAAQFAVPLFVAVLAGPVLGERPRRAEWFWLVLGFVGVVIIVRPSADGPLWAGLVVVGASLASAGMILALRKMPKVSSTYAVLFWFTAIGALVLVPAQLALNGPQALLVILEPQFWPALALLVLTGIGLHLCLTLGYRLARSTVVAGLDYLRLLWAILFGVVLFGEWPSVVDAAGMALLVVSGLAIFIVETRGARALSSGTA